MRIYYKKKSLEIKARKVSSIEKYIGLMFKSKNTENLFFDFGSRCKNIHSFFVFFKFLAIWLDRQNTVLKFEIVNPFSFLVRAPKKCDRLLEIPLNKKNKRIIAFFVGKEKI